MVRFNLSCLILNPLINFPKLYYSVIPLLWNSRENLIPYITFSLCLELGVNFYIYSLVEQLFGYKITCFTIWPGSHSWNSHWMNLWVNKFPKLSRYRHLIFQISNLFLHFKCSARISFQKPLSHYFKKGRLYCIIYPPETPNSFLTIFTIITLLPSTKQAWFLTNSCFALTDMASL